MLVVPDPVYGSDHYESLKDVFGGAKNVDFTKKFPNIFETCLKLVYFKIWKFFFEFSDFYSSEYFQAEKFSTISSKKLAVFTFGYS